ncbi:hypothetical protein PPTG_23996 [Phytophthora nicotianae INRA-310]|uniref:Uncharacterized protein n=1 Tax=Phytophthora nicotianae (strain INRA-310) TaxID=761204 RepID=W2PLP1_PHYN3|nr:hypothetical protein PPTG_23996 [Phytophthora nicotianae INRA-310]ETN01767.1 hypothetical protein PPTG_23996 [Phytophthora nicotianae INRA-310]
MAHGDSLGCHGRHEGDNHHQEPGVFHASNEATPYDPCLWKVKVLMCQSFNRVTAMETGAREILAREPEKAKLILSYGSHTATWST